MERTASQGDFRANLSKGGNGRSINLSSAETEMCIKATRSLDVLYDQSLTFIAPRDNYTATLFAQRVAGRKFVAIYEDANGLRKLIGTPKQPLRFTSELRTNPSAWSFSLSCQTKHPSYGWTDDGLLDTLGLDADFSFGFDYDFNS